MAPEHVHTIILIQLQVFTIGSVQFYRLLSKNKYLHVVWAPFSFEKYSFGLLLSPNKKKHPTRKIFLCLFNYNKSVEQCIPNGNISKKMIKMFRNILEMDNLAEGITQVPLKHICNL